MNLNRPRDGFQTEGPARLLDLERLGARVQLGVVLHRMGEVDEAVQECLRCLEDDPSDMRPRAYLASVSAQEVR